MRTPSGNESSVIVTAYEFTLFWVVAVGEIVAIRPCARAPDSALHTTVAG